MKFSVSAFQLSRVKWDSATGYVETQLKDAEKSDILVFPEKWIDETVPVAQIESLISAIDSLHKFSIIVPGSFSVMENGKLFNRSFLFSDGSIMGTQDKISLYGLEDKIYASGGSIKVFLAKGIRIAIAVCYDIDFPYYAKILARNGVDIILNPSLIRSGFTYEWHIYVRGRALEDRIPVASVNSISPQFGGNSIICSPYAFQNGSKLRCETSATEPVRVEIDTGDYAGLRDRRALEDPGSYWKDNITVEIIEQ